MFRIACTLLVTTLAVGWSPAVSAASTILARHPERVSKMEIASSSRDEVPMEVPVSGPWRIVHTIDGVRTWETRIPVRPRTLFFHRPPSGMSVKHHIDGEPSATLKHAAKIENAGTVNTWSFTIDALHVRRPIEDGPPKNGEYTMRYKRAIERERSLNRSMQEAELRDFVFRSVQVRDTTQHGLFLPAPSTIAFNVDVPENGKLRFDASILPPEAPDAEHISDGANLLLSVADGDPFANIEIGHNVETHLLDLSPWANEEIELQFRTDPGASNAMDYVFLAEPTVLQPDDNAPKMVLVFIDTLRADAMSLYGYERETSPKIDAWAEDAAVFTNARSVAPWTLPATRTMYTGTHPERWDKVETIQSRLAKEGWATGMVASNVYLSSNFKMSDGWGMHRCAFGLQGSVQVNRGLDFLEKHEGQPTFLLLHLMDMHLPYTEPIQYRKLFAGEKPTEFESSYFIRHEVTRAVRTMGEAGKAYVRGRYDNNMRYLDDELDRFFRQLPDDTHILIVSDHGEEFWEHGGFEHGHTLFDEVLLVPLIVKGPGVTAGRFDAPTSLLDLAPTMAAMQGISQDGMVGSDLRGLASGDAKSKFENRPQAFGRPLYGLRQWGSVHDGKKYTVHQGKEALFDLKKDPGESTSKMGKMSPDPLRKALSDALERPFVQAFRLVLNRTKSGKPVRVTLDQPMNAAWVGDDPTMKGKAKVEVTETQTIARWPKQSGMVEVFVIPSDSVGDTLNLTITIGKRSDTHTIELTNRTPPKPGKPDVLLNKRFEGRKVTMTTTWVPIPSDIDSAIEGFDAEVQGDLESLGYIEADTEK